MSNQPKIILINAVSIKMGGGLTYLKNFIKSVSESSLPFDIVIIKQRQVDLNIEKRLNQRLKIVNLELKNGRLSNIYFQLFILRRIIKKNKVNWLWQMANFAIPGCPCRQMILLRQSHYFSQPFLTKIYPLFSWQRKLDLLIRRWLIIQAAKIADLVMFPSQTMVDELRKFVALSDKKIFVNHYGVCLENFNADKILIAPKKSAKVKLLCCSHYGEHKNFEALFRAAEVLDKRLKKGFELMITADLNNPANKYCVTLPADQVCWRENAVRRHLKMLGPVAYEQVPRLYQEADIFVWPTLTESFGHPLIEAMAAGLPIIASDIPINREICGQSAMYYSLDSANDLAKKVEILLAHHALREKLVFFGKQRAKLFNWSEHVERLFKRVSQF